MLILTRWLNQSILIGKNITIKVLDVHGKQVRIGIEAPKDILIYRTECIQQLSEPSYILEPRKSG